MNNNLQGYQSQDQTENMTYSDLLALVRRLRALGIAVTGICAVAAPGGFTPVAGLYASIQDLQNLGMTNTDALWFQIQVNGGQSWNVAAWVANDLAPLTAIAVYKVLSELCPGNAQGALGSALMVLPGIDALVAQALK